MCLEDGFEDKLGLWDIGVPDRMLGPGWGLGPRVRTGTAKVRIAVCKNEICLTVRGVQISYLKRWGYLISIG